MQFENSNEIGVFANLTNAYCLVALGGSENFYRYSNHRFAYRCFPTLPCRRHDGSPSEAGWKFVRKADALAVCSVFQAELAEHIPVIKPPLLEQGW